MSQHTILVGVTEHMCDRHIVLLFFLCVLQLFSIFIRISFFFRHFVIQSVNLK